jgi:hypothetical protein
VYWFLFASIVCAGAALRAFWTYKLGLPLLTPDSESYIVPILDHPFLPFSEMRTAGLPAFLLLSIGVTGSPVGILLASNLLAIVSCVTVSIALRDYRRSNIVSLVVLLFLLFNAKEFSFEYQLMTEHLSAMMYLLYAASVLASFRTPHSHWVGFTLGALVLVNILVKPSAVALIVSTLMLYGFHAWREQGPRFAIARAGSIFVAVVATGLGLYVFAFYARYGEYNISQFEGFNQFSHVGHLTDFNSARHADIKKDLKPLIELYRNKYASRGNYQPNWLIYGTTTPELTRDFGDASPLSVVMTHLSDVPPGMRWRAANRIFGDLAFEGMRAHLGEYLIYAGQTFATLMWEGYSFSYFGYMPSGDTLNDRKPDLSLWRKYDYDLVQWRTILFRQMGLSIPQTCSEAARARAGASWPMRAFLGGAVLCSIDSGTNRRDIWVERVDYAYALVTRPLRKVFSWLPLLAVGGFAVMVWERRKRQSNDNGLAAVIFFALCCVGYVLLLSLISAAEPIRFLANIQGLMIICMVLATAGGLESLKEMFLVNGAVPSWIHCFSLKR